MKSTKIVTPVLLFLMIILLVIAVYVNFILKPLTAEIEEMSMENALIKVQRMEVELAMLEEDAIRKDIEDIKSLLKEDAQLILIDGSLMADDIYAKANTAGIGLESVRIESPDFADASVTGETVLLYTAANLSFWGTYNAAAAFIESMETSGTGAYKVQKLNVNIGADGALHWNMELRLYYYGSREEVPPEPAEGQEQEGAGLLPGILPGMLQ